MRDPHVEALFYKITSHEGISYKDPSPLAFSNRLGSFELANGILSVSLLEHFATEAGAREAVESILKAWEMSVDLISNIGTIRFDFDHSEIIDRDPPQPGESVSIMVQGAKVVCSAGKVTPHLTRREYPEPPLDFEANFNVKLAYHRWNGFNEAPCVRIDVASL